MNFGPFNTRAEMREGLPDAHRNRNREHKITFGFPQSMDSDSRERWIRSVAVRLAAVGLVMDPRARIGDCKIEVLDDLEGVIVNVRPA